MAQTLPTLASPPPLLTLGQALPDDDASRAPGGQALTRDEQGMWQALLQAQRAAELGEVPVGAVLADEHGVLLGVGFNRTICDHDPTAHAEIVALREAARRVGNYRLPGATLYVTLEPCVMCIGAMLHARLARIVYGAADPKTGACDSVLQVPAHAGLNHQTVVQGGVLGEVCGEHLREFFRLRRRQAREEALRRRAQQDGGQMPD